MEGDDEPDPENSGEDATGTRSDGSAVPSEMLMVSSSRLLELPAASVASVASKKGDVLHHLEQYYKSNFTSSASLTLEDTRRPGLTCVLPKNFVLPRSIVKRSLQFLDQEGSPDCPGEMKLGEMLKAMHRFHNKFGQDTTIDWDLQFLEDMGINTNSQTFDPDWMVQWNRPTLFSRFAVRLGTMERIYFVLDLGDNSSVISRCVSGFLFTAVLVSLLLWIGGTMESIRVVPCAGTEINTCVPLEPRWMKTAELVCVWIFTLEILLRLICAPQARRELLNHRFLIAVITDHQSQVQQPPSTHLGRFRKFIFSIEAICDILSVVPFWAEAVLETADKQVEQLSVLRALKVTRVVRVYKLTRALNADLGQFNEINDLFRKVMGNASPAILMTFLLIIIALFFFGTFIWFCERGEWVDASNPRYQALFAVGMGTDKGAWLRVSSDGLTEELSPFDSIPGVFWWTVVTITTVGYGDQVPTTPLGKIVGSVAMLYGTVILGLPLFVVGATFGQEYDRLMKDAKRRLELQNSREGRNAQMHQEKTAQFAKATSNFIEEHAIFCEAIKECGPDLGIPDKIGRNWKEGIKAALLELMPAIAMDQLSVRVLNYLGETEEMLAQQSHSEELLSKCRRLRASWYRIAVTSCQLNLLPAEVLAKVLGECLPDISPGSRPSRAPLMEGQHSLSVKGNFSKAESHRTALEEFWEAERGTSGDSS